MGDRLYGSVDVPGPPAALADLLARVRVEEDPRDSGELAARLPLSGEPKALSVSDLLASRRAFWRRTVGPPPIPPERAERLESGRLWHRRLGDAVAGDGPLEVRLRRGGLSARIDLLADVPVEIKTGERGLPVDLLHARPEYVEQVAIYCGLVGRSAGRLVHLVPPTEGAASVVAVEIGFHDLAAIEEETAQRESALRAALTSERPEHLPRCRWFAAGCEFRSAGVCDCRGDEPEAPGTIADEVTGVVARPAIEERWSAALRALPPEPPPPVARYRDLVYPRRAYFERTRGRPAPSEPAPARLGPPSDLYERLLTALERGPAGEVHRLPGGPGAPEEEILAWQGTPCLVRTSRARSRLSTREVHLRVPQYGVELGFRCAASGTERATVVVAYERAEAGRPAVQVLRYEFGEGVRAFARLWKDRTAALEEAVRDGRPSSLPPCPAWMVEACPYRDVCGCGESVGRSQR